MRSVAVHRTRFDGRTAQVAIDVAGDRTTVALTSHDRLRPSHNWGDVWLPIALFPAMRLGLPLRLGDPVSRGLQRSARYAQAVLTTWFPDLDRVAVTAPAPRRYRRSVGRSVGQVFTGGVDSFSTLMGNPDVTSLVYGHDLVHDSSAVRARMSEHLGAAADQRGCRLIEIDVDVRGMLDSYAEWGAQTHGAVLASMAALVSRHVTEVLIPASHPYARLHQRGSSPLLDHLWSGDHHTVIHDGAELTRFEKIAQLDAGAIGHLRVCAGRRRPRSTARPARSVCAR